MVSWIETSGPSSAMTPWIDKSGPNSAKDPKIWTEFGDDILDRQIWTESGYVILDRQIWTESSYVILVLRKAGIRATTASPEPLWLLRATPGLCRSGHRSYAAVRWAPSDASRVARKRGNPPKAFRNN